MRHLVSTRMLALAAVLAAAGCSPVFQTHDYAGLSPVSFSAPGAPATMVGQR